MKKSIFFPSGIAVLLIVFSCGTQQKSERINNKLFYKDNLVAWCVVPFDSVRRTPEERVEMLKELGFRQFAYDWRTPCMSVHSG